MRFKRTVERYGRTPEVSTPYARAGQLWDERLGSARAQSQNWRLIAFGGMILNFTLTSALAWTATQNRVTPYVVEVNKLGQAQAVSKVSDEFQPSDAQISWHIGRYISNVRGRSLDPVIMRENWLSAYDFSTARAAQFLSGYAREIKPFSDIGRRTIMVQVTSVVRASETSYRVNWTEMAFERGARLDTSRWTAILTIVQKTLRNAEVLRRNPLGIYIDAVDWSRELDMNVVRALSSRVQPPNSIPSEPLAPRSSNLPLGSPLVPPAGRAAQRVMTGEGASL